MLGAAGVLLFLAILALRRADIKLPKLSIAAGGVVIMQWFIQDQWQHLLSLSFLTETGRFIGGALLGYLTLLVTTFLTGQPCCCRSFFLQKTLFHYLFSSLTLFIVAEELIWRGAVMHTTITWLGNAPSFFALYPIPVVLGILITNTLFVVNHRFTESSRRQIIEIYIFFLILSVFVYVFQALTIGIGMHIARNFAILALQNKVDLHDKSSSNI